MDINEFAQILKHLCEERLNYLNKLIGNRILVFDSFYSFNHLLRCGETPTHFIGELLGANKFNPEDKIHIQFLQRTYEKIGSTNSFFIPYSKKISQPVINMTAKGNTLQSLLLITNENYLTMQKLPFPIFSAKINRPNGDFPLNISDSVDLAILKDVTLISNQEYLFYYRYIPFAFITKKDVTEKSIEDRLNIDLQLDISAIKQNLSLEYITGINYYYSEPNTYISNQLISFSNQIIKESYIDKYIEKQKSVIANALGYKNIHKISFQWIGRSEDEPQESKPDFVLEKKDNTFDILDLKTGAIKIKSLTRGKKLNKGQKIRIRFVDYVNELISQLEGYRDYFNNNDNIQYIKDKYGLDVDLDNLILIGIVGNQNNFERVEINTALKPYKNNIKIISYIDLAVV